jgi:hypothetical protein
LIESSPDKLEPYLSEIIMIFNLYADTYKGGELVAMFDALGTLAISMGPYLKNE